MSLRYRLFKNADSLCTMARVELQLRVVDETIATSEGVATGSGWNQRHGGLS